VLLLTSIVETIVPGVANYALRMRPPQLRLHYKVRTEPKQTEQVMNRTPGRSDSLIESGHGPFDTPGKRRDLCWTDSSIESGQALSMRPGKRRDVCWADSLIESG
jgi:hypothetical protein